MNILAIALGVVATTTTAEIRLETIRQEFKLQEILGEEAEKLIEKASQFEAYVPDEKLISWKEFQENLEDAKSIHRGVEFSKEHIRILESNEYVDAGLDSAFFVALMRVESDLGENKGTHPVFRLLYTQAMNLKSSRRWTAAAKRLAALARHCKDRGIDCFSVMGSRSGAIGLPQFMPDSVLRYGIDGDGDGIVNLDTVADAVPSLKNFLLRHGWLSNKQKAMRSYFGNMQSTAYPDAILRYAEKIRIPLTSKTP